MSSGFRRRVLDEQQQRVEATGKHGHRLSAVGELTSRRVETMAGKLIYDVVVQGRSSERFRISAGLSPRI
jgi:hypothetical protein